MNATKFLTITDLNFGSYTMPVEILTHSQFQHSTTLHYIASELEPDEV